MKATPPSTLRGLGWVKARPPIAMRLGVQGRKEYFVQMHSKMN